MMAYIEVKNLCKSYKTGDIVINALQDINFSIEKGEFVVILGASGAGKTTLLNVLGGMDKLTSGDYIIDGKNVGKASDKELERFRRQDIGFVFQFYNLMNNLSAYENVDIAASLVKDPLSTSQILEDVGLKDRFKNFPSQLSGGEQQRVAIARAIVKNPRLLLCDEPTGALDSKTGSSIIRLLFDISKKLNTTVIIVTHNSSLAEIGTRLIRIGDGKLIENKTFERRESLDDIVW
ncbi:MAG TPA: macrolide ABC transporter ATP-binding protein [Firmicutes bacterium]|nr:macrolide ABC transporter ATP-binding protein [Bacillota bacterium]